MKGIGKAFIEVVPHSLFIQILRNFLYPFLITDQPYLKSSEGSKLHMWHVRQGFPSFKQAANRVDFIKCDFKWNVFQERKLVRVRILNEKLNWLCLAWHLCFACSLAWTATNSWLSCGKEPSFSWSLPYVKNLRPSSASPFFHPPMILEDSHFGMEYTAHIPDQTLGFLSLWYKVS